MVAKFIYWEPSISEPAGHTGIMLYEKLYTFWPGVVKPDDTSGPVPSMINHNYDLERFTAGLRKLCLNDLSSDGARLPSGLATYKILYENFDQIIGEGVDITTLFDSLDPDSTVLETYRSQVISASIKIAQWIKDNEPTLSKIIEAGEPNSILECNFINEADSHQFTENIMALTSKLTWYAKVGAKTDGALNSGEKMRLASMLPEKSGYRYYKQGYVRHNCASFVLAALEAGGLDTYLNKFNEGPYAAPALQSTIIFAAQSKKQTPSQADLNGAASIGNLNFTLWAGGYGRKPISDWFGTTPKVLSKVVEEAENESTHRFK